MHQLNVTPLRCLHSIVRLIRIFRVHLFGFGFIQFENPLLCIFPELTLLWFTQKQIQRRNEVSLILDKSDYIGLFVKLFSSKNERPLVVASTPEAGGEQTSEAFAEAGSLAVNQLGLRFKTLALRLLILGSSEREQSRDHVVSARVKVPVAHQHREGKG